MGSRLVVDLGLLERSGSELMALKTELEAQPDVVDDARDAVGHGGLSDALGDFGGNWNYHRRKLVGALDAVAQMATQSAEVYRDTDQQLSTSFEGNR